MAPSSIPHNVAASHVAALLPKLHEDDPDFRFMALSDLKDILEAGHDGFLRSDYATCARTVDGLLKTLFDSNGEVQNMSLKCLGPFVNKVPDNILCPMCDRLSQKQSDTGVDQSIPSLALREIVTHLPRPVPGMTRTKTVDDAYNALSKVVIPRLVGYNVIQPKDKGLPPPPKGMVAVDLEQGRDSNTMDVLTEVARCFGPMLQDAEVQALLKTTIDVLENERAGSMIKKKAVTATATLAAYFSDALLSSFISRIIERLRDVHLTRSKRKLYITILGSMARSIPRKFGPYLKTLAPFVLSALSAEEADDIMEEAEEDTERDPEIDEVLEAALVAVEGFLASCSQDMRAYTAETIEAATRLLKYDPNLAGDDDDDDAMEDEDGEDAFDDDDFEEEAGYDDDEDGSWKVRRCAAKVLYTLISARSAGDLLDDGTLYQKVAPALIARFKEREESVRLEVLAALSNLIQASRDGSVPIAGLSSEQGAMMPPPSRKRRRGGSDASMFDIHTNLSTSSGYLSPAPSPTPPVGPRASLSKLSPEIIRGISQLFKNATSPPSTKQASIVLLKNMVLTQSGGLDNYLSQIIDPVVHAAKSSATGNASSASATANSLRIQALQLIGAIADTHSSAVLQPYLASIIPALLKGVQERYSKLSIEALTAAEKVIQALTPPRSAAAGDQNQSHLETLFDALIAKISANDADLEVRENAIHVLGLLLGRSSGVQGLVSTRNRTAGLALLLDRLKNELTRLSSVRAIDTIIALTKTADELAAEWVRNVALELSAQLRKSSRVLRGASLSALRTIALNAVSRQQLDSDAKSHIVGLLLPLLDTVDLHLLGPALIILATFVKDDAKGVVTADFNKAICRVAQGSISGSSIEALLALVRIVGEEGAGASLMQVLLRDVGINGNPEVLGKVEGNLLVYGGSSVGVTVEQFVTELETAADDRRKCLALAVLGEVALRKGSQSSLEPQLFLRFFAGQSETVPLAAAVALGRAGAGNVSTYLPAILSAMGKPSIPQYLLLHSIKEVLQQDGTESDIIPYTATLWQNLVAASQAEDNKAIGAECIGRLAIIDPKTYLPQLQNFMGDDKATLRGMVISALRFTFTDTDDAYDEYLRPVVVPMLTQMLNDPDMENRRFALTTFNSALHNKPQIILPCLDQLFPLALRESEIKKELIRTVTMGPFKIQVDDGVELRKNAYETLYALLETAFPRFSPIDLSDFFDRIIAGITDESEIRIICSLMLTKIMVLAPEQTRSRLETIAQSFRTVLSQKPKEHAVKQEIEKMQEANKGVLKITLGLTKALVSSGGSAMDEPQIKAWNEYYKWLGEGDLQGLWKDVQEEVKSREY